MKLFNIGMVLNWARKENDRRGCDSVFIKAAEDEYAALLKINKESAKLEAPLEEKASPNTQMKSASQIADELEEYFDPETDIDPRYMFDFVKEWCQQIRHL